MRKVIFANDEVYHVFNRGLEKRPVFTDVREFSRVILTLDFYRFKNPFLRLSKVLLLEKSIREKFWRDLRETGRKRVEIISYCFMPNHFHFLLRQKENGGISKFVSDFTNSYTRYFNTKHNRRIGPIFQGGFNAVRIEDDEQLLQVVRYICINPAVSFMVKQEDIDKYPWSSLPESLGNLEREIVQEKEVLSYFKSRESFKKFIFDQIDYAKKLDEIKHLILE